MTDLATVSDKPSLQRQKVEQHVYEATFQYLEDQAQGIGVLTVPSMTPTVATGKQLLSGASVRKALVKFENWAEGRAYRDCELIGIALRPDVVI